MLPKSSNMFHAPDFGTARRLTGRGDGSAGMAGTLHKAGHFMLEYTLYDYVFKKVSYAAQTTGGIRI